MAFARLKGGGLGRARRPAGNGRVPNGKSPADGNCQDAEAGFATRAIPVATHRDRFALVKGESMSAPVLKEGSPESVGMDPVRVERLKKLAAAWVSSGDTPSLVV